MKQLLHSLLLLGTVSGFPQNFTLDENSGILPVQRNWDEVAFEDIDGDGFVDLFTGGVTPGFWTVGRMYKNDGTGKFIIADEETFIKKREGGLAFGDVNGDGFPDMIVSGAYGNPGGALTKLYLNDGGGNFTLDESSSFVNVYQGDIRMFDYNNDGDIDILVSGMIASGVYAMHLYDNDGTGVFSLVGQTGLEQYGLLYAYLEVADFNNDGFLDIATNGRPSAGGGSSKMRIFINNGNSTFSLMAQPAFDYIATGAIAVGDVDNNGTKDLIFSGSGPSSDDNPSGFSSELFLNDGSGNFTKVENTAFIGHIDFPSVALADFNNDGALDLITMGRVTMSPATYGTYLYLNDGQGSFTLVENTPFTGHGFGKVTVADVNNDGNNDILITGAGEGSNSAVAKLYLNNVNLSVPTVGSQNSKVYPNPVQDVLNIRPVEGYNIRSVAIYTTHGSLIKHQQTKLNLTTIDVRFLNPGVYIVSLTGEDGAVTNYKIIKN